jgi:LuxR family transcriptional regulator
MMAVSEMRATIEFINEITNLPSVEEVWARHVSRMADWGFDRLLYASTSFRINDGAGDFRDALILTNYPQAYIDVYVDQELFRNSPTVRWAMKETGSRSWSRFASDAAEGLLTEGELRVTAFNRQYGITAGYAISFPKSNSRAGHGIGMSSSVLSQAEIDALWSARGAAIEAENMVMHLKLCTLPRFSRRRLSDRQREVLELVADGKTVQDVALVLGRNVATIEKHLRNVRDVMDAETTAQAVLKASMQNQLYLYGELDVP